MIAVSDKETIVELARRFNVSCVILFGSSLEDDREANDIDLGVKGIEPRLFFKFYAQLFKRLSKPVDLIDLSRKSLFNDLVEETGVRIYG
jgi:predicted nucleotidyltransferase